jgi:cytochrome c-type biogenesis protein CcmE
VDEVAADAAHSVGIDLRVEGAIASGSLERAQGPSNAYSFRLEHNHVSIPVRFAGALPDTIRSGSTVVAMGHFVAGGTFVAREVTGKYDYHY